MTRTWVLGLLAIATACGDDAADTVFFAAAHDEPATYWDFPFPSDLRLDATGAPDMTGFPNPRDVPLLRGLVSVVAERRGWPTMPVAYFRFTAPVPPRALADVLAGAAGAPALLVDIDPSSPEKGTRYPLVASTLAEDSYVTSNVVALAPRPGIVLRANTTYAVVLRESFAPGFAAPAAFTALRDGRGDQAAVAAYAPLWPALDAAGIDDALVATVFTTGDEVARLRDRSEAIRAAFSPAIQDLQLVGGATLDGFCHLSGAITLPQFQKGTPPFDAEGRFVLDGNDVPMRQGDLRVPVTITLPKAAMPASGWPLYQFFHGSGGLSTGIVDLGYSPTPDDVPELGKGPGFVVARHGIAAASAALPVNPERLPGATDYAYLNINNLAAFPFTFQQGVIEQRLFTDALVALEIPQAVVAACGIPAPAGGVHRFDAAKLVAGGQSMGGMYTNMVGALEPRFGALVPTGAGGFWNLMILETATIPGARSLLATALGIDDAALAFVHPALETMALGWEISEPMAYMARLARRPLDGVPVHHIYQPVGKDDVYFPIDVYDAAALAYGNQQAGAELWPSMQQALAVDGLGGVLAYPATANHEGPGGEKRTRVVVQYEGDGIIDAHYIYRQLEAVKHQYGCFFATYLRDGVPVVPAPGLLDDPCP
ncbi:MAG: hypothetical protein KF773_14755 [Deltaproteobacteria bacterium]|nr:hypothetical protein [Deltaproteobacteria bacterium]